MFINTKVKRAVILFQDKLRIKDLRRDSANGFIVNLGFKFTITLVEILSTMVLARIIMVEYFGVFAIATSIIALVSGLVSAGLSQATIQTKRLSFRQSSNLFWINTGLGLILTIIIICLSPLFAIIYKDQSLTLIIIVLAFQLFFNGLTIQHQALLSRSMRFKSLGLIYIISKVFAVGIGIIIALKTKSVWALVIAALSQSMFSFIITWITLKWVPALPKNIENIRMQLKFGWHISYSSVLMIVSYNIDKLLLGYSVGARETALYQKAYSLTRKEITEISDSMRGVSNASLSRLQDDPLAFKKYFYNFVFVTALLTTPIMIVILIYARDFVNIVLGPNWSDVVLLVQILIIGSILEPTSRLRLSVLLSLGKSKEIAFLQILRGSADIAAVLIGLYWGIVGVSIAIAITAMLYSLISIGYAFKNSPVTVNNYFKSISIPLASAFISGLVCLVIQHNTASLDYPAYMLINIASFILIYSGIIISIPQSRQLSLQYLSYIKEQMMRK